MYVYPHSLPPDLNFMPSLSNGHLGYTVFGNAIFMNGVYNGAGGNSRRARIPNWINITAELCDPAGCQVNNEYTDISYEMDLRGGYFKNRKSYASLGLTLEQRTYPHRYYNRALVYELLAYRHTSIPLSLGEYVHRNSYNSIYIQSSILDLLLVHIYPTQTLSI